MLRSFLTVAAAAMLLATAGCDSGSDPGDPVEATAIVTNAFGRPLVGGTVVVEAVDATGNKNSSLPPVCTATTTSTGAFQCNLAPGRYQVTITVPGYSTGSFVIDVDANGNATVDLPPLSGDGTINATMVDAITGAVLMFAHVQCSRRLPDGTYSEFEFEADTDAAGLISLQNLFLGEARCIVQAGASQIPVIITIEPETGGTIPVTPPPAAGQYRIVLSWGANPRDLDSHLTGPTGNPAGPERYHVYFSSRRYVNGDTLAVLDTDDTSGFGPETVTFTPTADGVYRYTVFNYTVQGTQGGQFIHDSPTRVQVYDSNGLRQTYLAPEPTSTNEGLISNAWRVVQITKQGSQITLSGNPGTPADQAQPGLLYVLANGSGDVGTFLTGGGEMPGPKAIIQ